MTNDNPLTREAFLYLAKEAGLNSAGPHMDELLGYVRNVLDSIRPLRDIDVGDTEPDMAFIPAPPDSA